MTDTDSSGAVTERPLHSARAHALADRLEWGARALAELTRSLADAQWHTPLEGGRRSVGVIVHHVASVYPVEIQLAWKLAAGQPITGVTAADIDAMNARHAVESSAVTKEETLDLLEHNSGAAAAAIRALTDEELAQAAPVSLYADAPLTCQFLLEDHAVRHSYHHLYLITRALGTS